MNPLDNQLDRLFRAAAPLAMNPVPPYGLETRVLAAWREAGTPGLWNMGVLVRGLLFALLIMGLSLWPALSQKSTPEADYLQLADSSLQVDTNP